MNLNTNTNTNTNLTLQQALARISELEALKKASQKAISYKVSEKGAISIYGLGRFPVTLYLGQMERLIEAIPELQAFINNNRTKLAVK